MFILLVRRMKIFRTGIFTVGFFTLFTAFLPHNIMTPLIALSQGTEIYDTLRKFDIGIMNHSFLLAQLVVSCLLIGYLIGSYSTTKQKFPILHRWNENGILKYPFIILLVFLIYWFANIAIRGFIFDSFNPLDLIQYARGDASFAQAYEKYNLSYPIYIAQYGFLISFALLIIAIFQNVKNFRFLIALVVLVFSMFSLLVSGSKEAFISPLIIFGLLTHYFYRKIPTWLLIVGVPLIVIIMPLYASYATGALSLDNIGELDVLELLPWIGYMSTQRFGNFQTIVLFMDWFDFSKIAYGSTLFWFFLRPIPRPLLPWKPQAFDIKYTIELTGEAKGWLLFDSWGEMMLNFWYPGVIIWNIFLGVILYRCHFGFLKMVKEKNNVMVALVISNFVLLRGTIGLGIATSGTQKLIIAVAAQVLVIFIIKFIIKGLKPNTKVLGIYKKPGLA